MIFTYQVKDSQEKKCNFITIINEIHNIFFWNPSVTRLLFELLIVCVWNLIFAWKSPCKKENTQKFLNIQNKELNVQSDLHLYNLRETQFPCPMLQISAVLRFSFLLTL